MQVLQLKGIWIAFFEGLSNGEGSCCEDVRFELYRDAGTYSKVANNLLWRTFKAL